MEPPSVAELIENREWEEIRSLLKCGCRNAWFDADYYMQDGGNTFHRACTSPDVPADIIETIARMFPRNLTRKTTLYRDTALHLAIACGSASTVQALVDLENERWKPQNHHYGKSHHHDCAGLKSWKERNSLGLYPLQLLWKLHVNPVCFVAGSRLNISAVERNEVAKQRVESFIQRMAETSSTKDLRGDLLEIWNKTLSILVASDRGLSRDALFGGRQWQTVHVIARSGGEDTCACPTVAMWYALKLYPDQVHQKDEDGNLPLHIAATSPSHHNESIFLGIKWDAPYGELIESMQVDVVEMLLNRFPRAARIQNACGRIPLSLAIEGGKDWNVIDKLVSAAPEALDTRDPKTRLFPFMQAATCERCDVGVVYGLLRANPSHAQRGIKVSHYEKYLENKLKRTAEQLSANKSKIARLERRVIELEAKLSPC